MAIGPVAPKEHLMKSKRLWYITPDTLFNGSAAAALAGSHGLALDIAEPRDLKRLEREQADVVIDWDGMPPDYRARLLNGTAVRVVAVHGFNVPDSVSGFLARRGVLISPRLGHAFFQALAAVRAA
jgi:hypothetical protein